MRCKVLHIPTGLWITSVHDVGIGNTIIAAFIDEDGVIFAKPPKMLKEITHYFMIIHGIFMMCGKNVLQMSSK